jgi:cytochrome c553
MRKILLMVAVAVLAGFVMFAQDKGGGKGGPGGGKAKAPPKNLKFFTQENWTTTGFPAMATFVAGLGLADKGGCNFCHEMDRSSDAKPEKVMARMMLGMVKEINDAFKDGKVHVTCFTCHRGSTEPLTAPPAN